MEEGKPSIKSRLGFKTAKGRLPNVAKRCVKNRTRSVKDRLGPRIERTTHGTMYSPATTRPVRERLGRRREASHTITRMACPTCESVPVWNRNEVNELRVYIKQGIKPNHEDRNNITGILLPSTATYNNCYRSLNNDHNPIFNEYTNSKKERRQKYLNEKCMEILRKEKADIREEDLYLINERAKRHFVKKVLLLQGKQSEYRSFRKTVKRQKDRSDERYGKMSKRKQNISDNLGQLYTTEYGDTQGSNTRVGNNDEEEEAIALDEEIYLEGDQEPEHNAVVKSQDDNTLESGAKLIEVLKPNSPKEIQKEMALTRREIEVQRSNDYVKKAPVPIKSREIINYGEIYTDTSPLTVNLSQTVRSADKEISLLISPVQQPSLKFEKRSWTTEIEDTSMKSYTEIMAQTKRHKLGLLPGNWHSPIPVVLAHSDPLKSLQRCMLTENTSDKISAVSLMSCSPANIESSSKTNPLQDTLTSNKLRSDTQTDVSNIVVGAEGVSVKMESDSWERRLKYTIFGEMASPVTETSDSNNVHLSAQTANTGTIPKVDSIMEKTGEYRLTKPMERLQGIDETKSLVRESLKTKYSETQEDSELQTLDSSSEFDDDFLNFECDAEIDTEWDKRKHDQLMKEMEELLA